MFKWNYKINGFKQTPPAFKGIDYIHEGSNYGVSLKTTIQTSKSGIKGLIKKNVEDLNEALKKGYVEGKNNISEKHWLESGMTNRAPPLKSATIQIAVPEGNLNRVQEIIDDLIDSGDIILDPNLDIQVNTIQQLF